MTYGLRHSETISNILKPGGGVKAWGWTDCTVHTQYLLLFLKYEIRYQAHKLVQLVIMSDSYISWPARSLLMTCKESPQVYASLAVHWVQMTQPGPLVFSPSPALWHQCLEVRVAGP
jgi:hypothetical protein